MGVIDTGKMILKARKAQAQLKKTTAAGISKSGTVAVLLNGLNEIEEVSLSLPEEVVQTLGEKYVSSLEQDIIEAMKAAKKELESQLAQNMDMDSIREMLGA